MFSVPFQCKSISRVLAIMRRFCRLVTSTSLFRYSVTSRIRLVLSGAGTTLRDRVVAVLGEGAHRAVFSIVSLVAHRVARDGLQERPLCNKHESKPSGKA